jgi:hypothetical protein
MSNTDAPDSKGFDVNRHVRELLAKHHYIGTIWSTEDVRDVRPHLTEDQTWEVLQQVGDYHDAEWGITWMTLETTADDMFPKPPRKRRRS